MITRKDVITAIKMMRGDVYPDPDGKLRQLVISLRVYTQRGEFDYTISSAIECLELAGYEIDKSNPVSRDPKSA